MRRKDKSIRMSLPEAKMLHGVRIFKLPVARYILALDTLENLPEILTESIFPEIGDIQEMRAVLEKSDSGVLEKIIVRLIRKVPVEFCRCISVLLDIPEQRLLDPQCSNALSINELLEILNAFLEMNDLSDFFVNVRRLRLSALPKKTAAATGCKDGSPLPRV